MWVFYKRIDLVDVRTVNNYKSSNKIFAISITVIQQTTNSKLKFESHRHRILYFITKGVNSVAVTLVVTGNKDTSMHQ